MPKVYRMPMNTFNAKMRTVIAGDLVQTTPAHPSAELGTNAAASAETVEITDIPEGTPLATVARIWSETCHVGWLGKDPSRLRQTFAWSEIGFGRTITKPPSRLEGAKPRIDGWS
jgi:hypothetical protein